MNAQAGLMDAIRADPDSDELRLVMADWLDDHDQAERAEFIRLQVILARLPEHHESRPEVESRIRGLLLLHRAAWDPTLPGEWGYRCGFAERLRVRSSELLARPADYLGSGLVRQLDVSFPDKAAQQPLTQLAGLTSVRSLCLSRPNLGTNFFFSLVESPVTRNVAELQLLDPIWSREVFGVLAGVLGRLRALDLSYNALTGDDVRAIFPARPVPLERLDLSGNRLNADTVAALLTCRGFTSLNHLALRGLSLTDAARSQLARAPFAPSLANLDLSGNLDLNSPQMLTDAGQFPALESLDLTNRGGGWNARPGPLGERPSLRRLALSVGLAPDGLARWLAAPAWPRLETLAINSQVCDLSRNLCETLTSSASLFGLRRLTLQLLERDPNLPILLSGPNAASWRHLSIDGAVFRSGLDRKFPPGFGRGLTSLALSHCRLTDADLRMLARRPELANLRELVLIGDRITNAGARALVESPYLTRLESLNLYDNAITDGGIFAGSTLARAGVLNLSSNPVKIGTDALARSRTEATSPKSLLVANLLREVMP